jgi:hypothetical protein
VTFEEARAQFPVFERYAYLNAGTNGPLARSTVEAMADFNRRDLERGRGGKAYFEEVLALRERAREALAGVLEVAPENVALVSSTTNACNVVLAGLGLTPEDEIVTTDAEHFGLLGPLLAAPATVRVAHLRDAPPKEASRLISEQVTSRTKLIAISHVSWVTGNSLHPLELPRRPELQILVDGAQSAGVFQTEADEFDFYTASGRSGFAVRIRPERSTCAIPSACGSPYRPTCHRRPTTSRRGSLRSPARCVRLRLVRPRDAGRVDRGARSGAGMALRAHGRDRGALQNAIDRSRLRGRHGPRAGRPDLICRRRRPSRSGGAAL